MHRFYCPHINSASDQGFITHKDELHHLRNVLRLKKNDTICLFNGTGVEAEGTLFAVTTKKASIHIHRIRQIKRKSPLIILACAIPKKSKFELIIEKGTELGVDEIIPLQTQRTEIKMTGERLNKKQSRYQTIAVNASKQSKRLIVPVIHPVTSFAEALTHLAKTTTAIIPSLTEKTENLLLAMQKIKSPKAVSFFIGPEGDFTSEEYALAQKNGLIPVSLGETVLKVETAAMCSLSCANLYFRPHSH